MCLCTWTYAAAWGWKHPTQSNHMTHRNRRPASHTMLLGSPESSGRYAQSRNAASARIPHERPCYGSACRWQELTSEENMEMTGVFENKIFCKNHCRLHRNESQLYVVFHKVQMFGFGLLLLCLIEILNSLILGTVWLPSPETSVSTT